MNTATTPLLLPRRTPSLLGSFAGDAAAVAFVWVAALSVTLVVAAFTKIGPVVLRVTATHGLHLGDVLTGMIMGMLALAVTAVIGAQHLLRRRPGR
jgi:hypothetical protein